MFSELWVPELETSQSNNSTRFYDGLGGHTKEDVKAPVKARSIIYASINKYYLEKQKIFCNVGFPIIT